MLPIVNSITTPVTIQPTLVSTPLPDNQTLRVPPGNVPPTVSNVQIHNNARGSSGGFFVAPETAPAIPPPVDDFVLPVAENRIRGGNGFGAPATFLAQLMSQDVPPEVQQAMRGVLVEYEKMILMPYVKYKPSNATLPEPAPSGVFGKLLQEQKAAAPRFQPSVTSEPVITSTVAARVPANLNIPTPRPAPSPNQRPSAEPKPETFSFAAAPVMPAPVVVQAYASVQNNLPKITAADSV